MKRKQLRKWVKIAISVVLTISLYIILASVGTLATTSQLIGLCVGLGWLYLLFIHPIVIYTLLGQKRSITR